MYELNDDAHQDIYGGRTVPLDLESKPESQVGLRL
jgi:hypothetical protein